MTKTILKATQTANGLYRIAYDGRIMGDDRGFANEELCKQEIRKRLEKDAREAVIYNRPLLYVAG
jgi:hypothetical protein